tara:strand:- start:2215 stop:3162 length:948 start_codon:yes stop_codon:yes gene_type:complete
MNKLILNLKKLVLDPGGFFYRTKRKRIFYKNTMQSIINILKSKSKKNWLQSIKTLPSFCIDDKKGYLVLPPNALSAKLSEQVEEVCNEIINSGRKPTKRSKDFLLQLLTDKDIEENPSLLNFALSDELLSIVSKYLVSQPILMSMKLMKSVRTEGDKTSSQLFHCDYDDTKQVAVFLNIKDVTLKNGPLTLVPADVSEKFKNDHGYQYGKYGHLPSSHVIELNQNKEEIIGPKGQVLLLDTSNVFHCGSIVEQGERYIFYLQYTTESNFLYNPLFAFLPKRFVSKFYPFLDIAKKAKITKNLYALGRNLSNEQII